MKHSLILMSFLVLLCSQLCAAAGVTRPGGPPHPPPIKVAFVLGDYAVPTDFAGPWDVLSSVHLPDEGQGMDARMPFELYTVSASTATIRTTGNRHPGMAITPDYSFDTAPEPDIVIVPAQKSPPGLSAWLQNMHERGKTIVAICTGAFRVAEAGLLDGKTATTHRNEVEILARQHPNIKVVKGVRFIQDGKIYSSAGISAGIDLTLHIVDQYYGRAVAQAAADDMQYESTGWKWPGRAPQQVRIKAKEQ